MDKVLQTVEASATSTKHSSQDRALQGGFVGLGVVVVFAVGVVVQDSKTCVFQQKHQSRKGYSSKLRALKTPPSHFCS